MISQLFRFKSIALLFVAALSLSLLSCGAEKTAGKKPTKKEQLAKKKRAANKGKKKAGNKASAKKTSAKAGAGNLLNKVGLNAKQKEQVASLNKSYKTKLEGARKSKNTELVKKYTAEKQAIMNKILTPEQQKKLAKLKANARVAAKKRAAKK